MSRFERHLFICENIRDASDERGCCAAKGSPELRQAFKRAVKERGLRGKVRANASGCLDACEFGPSMVVYPEGVWYGGVNLEDVTEIVESHLIQGIPVERLRIRDPKYRQS